MQGTISCLVEKKACSLSGDKAGLIGESDQRKKMTKERKQRAPQPEAKCDLVCPIAAAAAIFGDRWTVQILSDLLRGLRRFDEFVYAMGIATNILANRLSKLEDAGLVEKKLYQEHPPRYEYVPTKAAASLFPTFVALANWSHEWCVDKDKSHPLAWVNAETDNPLNVALIDGQTGERVSYEQITLSSKAPEQARNIYKKLPRFDAD